MTNAEIFTAKCLNYNPSPLTVKDALDDEGLVPEADCTDKKTVVKAVVRYLSGMRSLSSEKEADLSNSYDRKGLEDHILMLCKQCGLNPKEFLPGNFTEIEDISCML